MAAYLSVNRPARDQWYHRRNRPLTGCTVLHTAESIMDEIGPDTGAEAVANFIRTRTTPGSYHDLVDSDSALQLVEYIHGAYHDGTGSNNWALSLSFACRTSDWGRMSAEKRRGFLRQGAKAFARQQAWRKANGAPLTELRLISKAESDAGMSGFTYHGYRDPGRRTDPGVRAPYLFPFAEFIAECRAALAGTTPEEDDMPSPEDIAKAVWNYDAGGAEGKQEARNLLSQVHTALTVPVRRVDADASGPEEAEVLPVSRVKQVDYIDARTRRLERDVAEILELLRGQQKPPAA